MALKLVSIVITGFGLMCLKLGYEAWNYKTTKTQTY